MSTEVIERLFDSDDCKLQIFYHSVFSLTNNELNLVCGSRSEDA